MVQDVNARATGCFEGIGEDGEIIKQPVGIHPLGELNDSRSQTAAVESRDSEILLPTPVGTHGGNCRPGVRSGYRPCAGSEAQSLIVVLGKPEAPARAAGPARRRTERVPLSLAVAR